MVTGLVLLAINDYSVWKSILTLPHCLMTKAAKTTHELRIKFGLAPEECIVKSIWFWNNFLKNTFLGNFEATVLVGIYLWKFEFEYYNF